MDGTQERPGSERAAFVVWQDRIAPVFSAATEALVYERTGAEQAREVSRLALAPGPTFVRAAQFVDAGVSLVVCGALTRPEEAALMAYGLRVLPFVTGSVEELVSAWAAGRLDAGPGSFAMPGVAPAQEWTDWGPGRWWGPGPGWRGGAGMGRGMGGGQGWRGGRGGRGGWGGGRGMGRGGKGGGRGGRGGGRGGGGGMGRGMGRGRGGGGGRGGGRGGPGGPGRGRGRGGWGPGPAGPWGPEGPVPPVGGPGQGFGPVQACVCPACGYEAAKEPGVPCATMQCPNCGTGLVPA